MKDIRNQYVKRTQKDYGLSFKLSVVQEIESGFIGITAAKRKYGIQGDGTIRNWLEKYGTFDIENQSTVKAMQSPQQKIAELEQKLRLLERQNKFLEERLTESEDKASILDKLIDLAEEEYLIPVRKNSLPDPSETSTKKVRKQ